MSISSHHVARLIRANVPLANMALITGIDADKLMAKVVPAACAEHGLTFAPTRRLAA